MYIGDYKLTQNNNSTYIEGVRDFSLVHTFECGQCFRWIKQHDGSYNGVANYKAVNISMENDVLIISNSTIKEFKDYWFDYLDLGTDYSKIKAQLSFDPVLTEPIKFGWGIRILRQNIWEMLISFIISANNRIPRIMSSVEKLSTQYGEPIKANNSVFYAFPQPSNLADADPYEILECKAGFRCKYIQQAARMVVDNEIDLNKLHSMDTSTAQLELQKVLGVGKKVADCVLLYSGTKLDVFPTDVWVKRVMEELYFKRECSINEIHAFSQKNFEGLSGYAQQYLFYYAREHGIGSKQK